MARSLDPSGWGTQEELLATLIEIIDYGNRQFFAAHASGHQRIPDAIRIPRPYQQQQQQPRYEEVPEMSSPEEVRAFFGG